MTSTAIDTELVAHLRTSLISIARRIDRQVSSGGLTRTEVSVLAAIVGRGPIKLADLAARQGINPTMLSRVIGKLQSAELIRRQSNLADRRAGEVIATRKGERVRERLLAERSALLAERLGQLPPESIEALAQAAGALRELAEALDSPLESPPSPGDDSAQ
jgi:DNA-binding MarR family transcriptional regulator